MPTSTAVASSPAEPGPAVAFVLKVHAPEPMAGFLAQHAELQRFQHFEDLGLKELERLVLTAPNDFRQLLATQGHFSPSVDLQLLTPDGQVPQVHAHVDPGPRARVRGWEVVLQGLPEAQGQVAYPGIERAWGLTSGHWFTQTEWDKAKQQALRALTQHRYPQAQIVHSQADIDTDTHEADLSLHIEVGPAYRFGALSVQGHERYDPATTERIVRLAGVRPGADYGEEVLQRAQQRLLELGYLESAFVGIDMEAPPEAAPVTIRVREAPEQKIVLGLGASTDNGARLSLEHQHHRLPGWDWRASTKLQLERDASALHASFDSPVDEQGWHWNLATQSQRQRVDDLLTTSQQLKWGPIQSGHTLEKQLYGQYDRSRLRNALDGQSDPANSSVSAHYAWTKRAFDNPVLPTQGQGLSWEIGAGLTLSETHLPYVRTRLRWQSYHPDDAQQPWGDRWVWRLDGGLVWSSNPDWVPATQRFLAGGDQSVRGYGLRTIGLARANGVGVDPGPVLALASLEWQHPWWTAEGRRSEWETTWFVDTGSVASQIQALSWRVGVGTGVRYRSPVGPLQIDLAYGVQRQAFRLHMSVGFVF